MKQNEIDLVANLLAEEDLTIVRQNVRTASFNVKTRILTLPVWKFMNPALEGMLVAHEVGHALFTDTEKFGEMVKGDFNGTLFDYFNIIEDVRIERLMKDRYPGIRKTFYYGYANAVRENVFGTEGGDWKPNSMLLIDRINLYFKAGNFLYGIKFTAEENVFVDRARSVATIEDAAALALELYTFAKTAKKPTPPETEDQQNDSWDPLARKANPDDDLRAGENSEVVDEKDLDQPMTEVGGGSSDEDEEDGNNEDLDPSNDSDGSDELTDEEIAPVTDEAFNSTITKMIDSSAKEHVYYTPFNRIINPIISYKTVGKDFSDYEGEYYGGSQYVQEAHKRFLTFMNDTNKNVSYMVKEFEMRKAATAYSKTQISKSGSLNMNKVYAYKTSDDIFKRVTAVANGKNHGMVLLVDWSGSMDSVMNSVLIQTVNLVLFCRKINIPFEVYAFSTNELSSINQLELVNAPSVNVIYNNKFKLINFFSSKMSEREFTSMIKSLIIYKTYERSNKYRTHATPLNDALLYMLDFLPKYIKENGIEKMTFVTLTDGESRNMGIKTAKTFNAYYCKNIIVDPITRKNYEFSDGVKVGGEILRMIKDRYGITLLTFDIFDRRKDGARLVTTRNYMSHPSFDDVTKFNASIKANGFATITGGPHDAVFGIYEKNLGVANVEVEVSGNETVASLAKKFGKAVSGAMASRVLLTNIIKYIA